MRTLDNYNPLSRFNWRKAIAFALLLSLGGLLLYAQPTDFPQAKEEWPGRGPAVVHPWFKDNRNYFWSRQEKDQGAIVFVGDSLIGNWKGLNEAFPEHKTANRGIGGDGTRGVLFRFQEDVLDLHPSAIVILAGTNDLSAHANIDDILYNMDAIFAMTQEKAPGTPVILCTIPPRDHPKARLKSPSDVVDLNSGLIQLATKYDNVEVLDIYAMTASPEGQPREEFFNSDKLHFNPAAYELLRKSLLEKLPAKPDPQG